MTLLLTDLLFVIGRAILPNQTTPLLWWFCFTSDGTIQQFYITAITGIILVLKVGRGREQENIIFTNCYDDSCQGETVIFT